MSWSTYGSFVVVAVVLIVIPGPDFAVVTKNALAGGRRRGAWSSLGVASAAAVQGIAAAAGLGAAIAHAQPVFRVITWVGAGYLVLLAAQALRSAVAGRYAPLGPGGAPSARGALTGWRQGFLANITNPKVLVFYLALLPQFLGPDPSLVAMSALALTHAALTLLSLLLVVAGLHRARHVLMRRRVRRSLDAVTGVALLGFGARLITE
ncbi:LysE family translocator [Modestobacter marinus]|uniref:Lysine transporter LysE n=1 Tax=Modestobacter marinus TaxID=477641 RepID=A0A846LSK8_9ACTN|nr:LysE family translocator [Modestobacter marinus]NIH69414.1 threonine/homoserine/homoserine lactone efflux protein [Modestobacter marinus]GGL73559.1 lysine transporter LysE [Modestobacter marinus]